MIPVTEQDLERIERELEECKPQYDGSDRGLKQADLIRQLNIQSWLCSTYMARLVATIREQQKQPIPAIQDEQRIICDNCDHQASSPFVIVYCPTCKKHLCKSCRISAEHADYDNRIMADRT